MKHVTLLISLALLSSCASAPKHFRVPAAESDFFPDRQAVAREYVAKMNTKRADYVFFGEIHQVAAARTLLREILAQGVSTGLVTGLATEYVLASQDHLLQEYLAASDAQADRKLRALANASIEAGYFFFRRPENLEFFSALRTIKKSHPAFKVCGIDDRGHDLDEEVNMRRRRERYSRIPPSILNRIRAAGIDPHHDMVVDDYGTMDREAYMAMKIKDCHQGIGATVLVHIGAGHAPSTTATLTEMDGAPASVLVAAAEPGKTIFTSVHFQQPGVDARGIREDIGDFGNGLRQIYTGLNAGGRFYIRELNSPEAFFNYYILGP